MKKGIEAGHKELKQNQKTDYGTKVNIVTRRGN